MGNDTFSDINSLASIIALGIVLFTYFVYRIINETKNEIKFEKVKVGSDFICRDHKKEKDNSLNDKNLKDIEIDELIK